MSTTYTFSGVTFQSGSIIATGSVYTGSSFLTGGGPSVLGSLIIISGSNLTLRSGSITAGSITISGSSGGITALDGKFGNNTQFHGVTLTGLSGNADWSFLTAPNNVVTFDQGAGTKFSWDNTGLFYTTGGIQTTGTITGSAFKTGGSSTLGNITIVSGSNITINSGSVLYSGAGRGRLTGQTGAISSLATWVVGGSDGTFEVFGNVNVTTFGAGTSFNMTVAYTDEGNTARTLDLNFSTLTGTLGIAIGAAGPFEGIPSIIRAKSATAITVATSGTFLNSPVYNAECNIIQIA